MEEIYITIFTIAIVVVFAVIIILAFLRERKKIAKYSTDLVFKKYNKKLDKISKLFKNEKLDEILNNCRLKIVEKEKMTDEMIFENIKIADKVQDNWLLLKNIQKEFSHRGRVEDKISLLKKPLEVVNLEKYEAQASNIKHKAIMFFFENLKQVPLDKNMKAVLSGTPCFKFGDNFMFLGSKVLKVDPNDLFAVEILEYDSINLRVWFKDEEWINYDKTYNLDETTHKPPNDPDDPYAKEQVLQKKYILSFKNGTMTYDIIHKEVITELQQKFDKLTTTLK